MRLNYSDEKGILYNAYLSNQTESDKNRKKIHSRFPFVKKVQKWKKTLYLYKKTNAS